MSLWEAIALVRRILAKPWAQSILGFLKKLFDDGMKPDTTPVLPPNHPDRKRKWPDDWNDGVQ